MKASAITLGMLMNVCGHVAAQVAIHPTTIRPAAWERVALRVVNQTDLATVRVRVDVPEALDVLGVERATGWDFSLVRATDTTPQFIEWSGNELGRWEFHEFAWYGRTGPDVRERELVFPVTITKTDGRVIEWSPLSGASAPPPVIQIVGTTEVSNWGAFAIAAAAMGLSILSIALSVSTRRASD